MTTTRGASERPTSPDVRRTASPQISLLSFVLGFLLGCMVFLGIGVHTVCIGECSSSTDLYVRTSSSEALVHFDKELVATVMVSLNETLVTQSTDQSTHVTETSGCPNRPLHLVVLYYMENICKAPFHRDTLVSKECNGGTWMEIYGRVVYVGLAQAHPNKSPLRRQTRAVNDSPHVSSQLTQRKGSSTEGVATHSHHRLAS